jgi:hypothetical protein
MCWHNYGWRWEREPERTSEPVNNDDLRIADSDRERAIAQLSKHVGDGRLTLEEFEERVAEVYAARTDADLRPVFRGLPWYDDAPMRRRRSHTRPRIAVDEVIRSLVMLAVVVCAAIAFGAWVLFIGFWILLPRLGRGWNRHGRLHHVDHEQPRRPRDEQLTSV